MSNQTKNNNLKYLIDSMFIKANRLFVFRLYFLKMKMIEYL